MTIKLEKRKRVKSYYRTFTVKRKGKMVRKTIKVKSYLRDVKPKRRKPKRRSRRKKK